MSQFITDKIIQTLNYDLLSIGKELKEMTLLVKANSTTIADLLGLIREQNKSLTELRRDVESLKSELGVLKKGDCVVEKVDVSVESKTTVEQEIKPEDKAFRHFEFDKSWEDLPEVKKWGESKVVYGVYFNLVRAGSGTTRVVHQQISDNHNHIIHNNGLVGSKFIEFENFISIKDSISTELEEFMSIKDSILIVQKFFQEDLDKSYIDLYKELNTDAFYPYPYLTFPELLQKKTVKGYFLSCNKIQSIKLVPRTSILNIDIYS